MTDTVIRATPGPAVSPEVPPHRPAAAGLGLPNALVCLVGATVIWLLAMARVDLDRVNDLGILPAVPMTFFLAVGLLTASFLRLMWTRPDKRGWLWAHLVALVVFLHAIPALVETVPRFSTVWIHAGFVDQIVRTGETLPMLDARFSWAGFFSLFALVAKAGGVDDPLWFARWAPVLLNLALLPAVAAIFRTAAVGERARWFGLWVFVLANWVGQDYFSPQGLNFLLYLAVIAVILWYFRRPGPAWSLEEAPAAVPGGQRAALAAVLLLLFAATVVSHQLTPFALVGATAALVVGRRTTFLSLPVLMGVAVVAWISFATVTFWSGHLENVVGDFGRPGSVLNSSVATRLSGSAGHEAVLRTRLLATAGLWALAAFGAARSYLRRRRIPVAHGLLAVAPIPLLGLQSYGGEILLRVYLFSLPFVALFVAMAFFPDETGSDDGRATGVRRRRLGPALAFGPRRPAIAFGPRRPAAVLSISLALAFVLIRYGNERFEYFSVDEAAAVEYVYDNAAPGSRLVTANPQVAWRHRDIDHYTYVGEIDPEKLGDTEEVLRTLQPPSGGEGWLILTRAQEAYGEMVKGLPAGWTQELANRVEATGRAEVVLRLPDAVVLRTGGSR